MDYINFKVEIWCGLEINMGSIELPWLTLIGPFSVTHYCMIHHTIVGATKLIDHLKVVGTTGSTSMWVFFGYFFLYDGNVVH